MSGKRRIYLGILILKAWKEVSFIEVLSEAIGGFVFAVVALFKGWMDFQNAFETILECAGCAILIPLVAFLLRVIFVAPGELVKELAESKKKDEVDPKSIYPSIITILLVFCSFLIIGIVFSLKFNFSKIEESAKMAQASKTELPKPLPDKVIPAPAPPAVVPVSLPPANIEAPIQFETNNPAPDDVESEFEKAKAEQEAEQAAQNQQTQIAAQKNWETGFPVYNYTLESLYKNLNDLAQKRGDGIAKTVTYFRCIPQSVPFEVGETNVAEIRFQKETNIDFKISISRLKMYNQRSLLIYAPCGNGGFEIEPDRNGSIYLHVQMPYYDKLTYPSYANMQNAVDGKIAVFIGATLDCLGDTNKQ